MTELNVNTNEYMFEYKAYKNDSYNISIFDDLLKREDISEDTKALITVQREIYIQNETLNKNLCEKSDQITRTTDAGSNRVQAAVLASIQHLQQNGNYINEIKNSYIEGRTDNSEFNDKLLAKLESSSNKLNDISNQVGIVSNNTQVVADSVPISNATNSYLVGGIMLAFGIVALYFVCKPVWFIMTSIV